MDLIFMIKTRRRFPTLYQMITVMKVTKIGIECAVTDRMKTETSLSTQTLHLMMRKRDWCKDKNFKRKVRKHNKMAKIVEVCNQF